MRSRLRKHCRETLAVEDAFYAKAATRYVAGIADVLNRKALQTPRGSPWRLEHVARIIKQATSPR
jgi:hypothetical protein